NNAPGIAFATSGPGATNLLTGIGSCYFDSTPTVFITGQVNTHEQKGESKVRQLGFQETDIVAMAKPITKKTFLVNNPASIPEVFEEAFKIAVSGRPGPVLIDIPMNVQSADILVKDIKKINREISSAFTDPKHKSFLIEQITKSKKPLILAGAGVRLSGALEQFDQFIGNTGIPVICSLMGLDVISFNDTQRVGFIGSYGNRWANKALGLSDLIIVLGSRLDIRQTGADTNFFQENRTIIHIDIDESEINNRIKGCHKIVADLAPYLESVNKDLKGNNFSVKAEWLKEINSLKTEFPDTKEIKDIEGINPNIFIHKLSQASKKAGAFVADVGNHQMWTAQSLELSKGQRFITSGGMGAMGFALPAAIGACIGMDKKPVVLITGDGSMQINIQELQTIRRNTLPIKMIVLNNQSLGMIRQFQDNYFKGRYQSTLWGYDAPNFEKVAAAYGINSITINDEKEIDSALKNLWKDADQPFLLHVMIDTKANAYPKIAFGKPITEMEPDTKPNAMEGT
ncbi:MAG: thiamine pyrophosphate-binding protein, partial [Bacteroidetes bacterium]|nr:thiamine pyrophosphate-binding protein [Bacteroidota bacterium]